MSLNYTCINNLVVFLLLLPGFSVFSQTNYKHYTSTDGLPHDVTYNIVQDSKGYIWIGTDDGLSKFDGDNFKNYSFKNGLNSNYVTDIEELPDNKFAIATWGAGLHFLENDSIYKNEKIKDENLKIYDIKYLNNQVHTFSGVSLVVYDLNKSDYISKVYLKKNNSFSIEIKQSDSILKLNQVILNNKIYVHNKELAKYNFKGISEFTSDFKLKPAFPFLSEFNITTILPFKVNHYVFGAIDKLVFTDESSITNTFLVKNIQQNEYIHKILKAPENDDEFILIIQDSQRQKRLIGVNVKTNLNFDIEKILDLKTTISDAVFDFEGNLWVSTFGDGVYCYYYSNPKIDNYINGEYVIDVIKLKQYIYAQASSKLYEFNGQKIVNSYLIDGFPKHLSVNNEKVSLALLNKKSKLKSKFNTINGRFYKETKHGIVRQSDTLFLNDKILMISNEILINKLIEGDGIIDFYTNKGKWIYNTTKYTFEKDIAFQKKLPSENIKDIVLRGDTSYLATDRGLVIKKENTFKVFDEENGLQNERINCVLVNEGVVYLGTQRGLSVIKNDVVYNFSKSFGIKSLAINKIIHFNQKLLLAGNDGISIVNINDIKTSKAPKLHIKQEGTMFLYNVVTFQDRKAIATQYKINGGEWINLNENKGSINFKNYAPNTYSVKFRTQNSYSPWALSKTHTFLIKQPWYKIWWVILLFVFGSLILVFFVFYKRLKKVSKRNAILKNEIDKRIIAEKELNEVRDNIARDFHDDLGNKLASISLMSDVLSNKVKNEATEAVKTIKNDADYLYKGTKDFIFSLQEKSNYLDEVRVYLTDFSEDYLYQFGIDFEVESNIKKNIKLPFYWSKQIVYIFKEAITNTVKHSKSSNAKMKFNFDNDKLKISFYDDGIGYDINLVNTNGILNMESRAIKIGCELKIKSNKNKGTKVLFIGKLPQ